MTKSGKTTCSCPNGTVSTVKNLRNVCEPATFSTFTAVPDLASELAMSDDEIARALLIKEPAVRPVDNDDGGSSTAVVLLLFILVLIILILAVKIEVLNDRFSFIVNAIVPLISFLMCIALDFLQWYADRFLLIDSWIPTSVQDDRQ